MGRRRHRPRRHARPPQPEREPRSPTAVSFEMDVGYDFPLVDAAPGGVDFQDAQRLGLSPELGAGLRDWAQRWETLAMREVRGEPSPDSIRQDEADLVRDQWALADALRRELPGEVDLLVDGLPLDEWRAVQRRHR